MNSTVLIELHGAGELDKVMRSGLRLIGINNRDLIDFHGDLAATIELMKHIPREVVVVAESGITGNGKDSQRRLRALPWRIPLPARRRIR